MSAGWSKKHLIRKSTSEKWRMFAWNNKVISEIRNGNSLRLLLLTGPVRGHVYIDNVIKLVNILCAVAWLPPHRALSTAGSSIKMATYWKGPPRVLWTVVPNTGKPVIPIFDFGGLGEEGWLLEAVKRLQHSRAFAERSSFREKKAFILYFLSITPINWVDQLNKGIYSGYTSDDNLYKRINQN